jgi:sn-glycerol 3-phosphate transport system substrate-binding protein
VAPAPALSDHPAGGSPLFGWPLYLVKGDDPARVEASYRFARWLLEADQQAEIHMATGTVPARRSVAVRPDVQQFWTAHPDFRVAYDDLASEGQPPGGGRELVGPFTAMNVVDDAWTSVVKQNVDPEAALAKATEQFNQLLADYNSQLKPG